MAIATARNAVAGLVVRPRPSKSRLGRGRRAGVVDHADPGARRRGSWLWETFERIEAEIKAQGPRRRPGRRGYPITALLLVEIALKSMC